jgi:hypothetical protein
VEAKTVTEYELEAARNAFEIALKNGAPGLKEIVRKAIANGAVIRLRHQFNVPTAPLSILTERDIARLCGGKK